MNKIGKTTLNFKIHKLIFVKKLVFTFIFERIKDIIFIHITFYSCTPMQNITILRHFNDQFTEIWKNDHWRFLVDYGVWAQNFRPGFSKIFSQEFPEIFTEFPSIQREKITCLLCDLFHIMFTNFRRSCEKINLLYLVENHITFKR